MHTPLEELLESAREAARNHTWDEAVARFEEALRRLPAEGGSRDAAETLRAIGRVHFERGALEEACEVFDVSLVVAEANHLPEQVASALNCLAVVEQFRGDIPRAEHHYLESWKIAEAMGDARRLAMIDQNLATLSSTRGDLATASLRNQAALERYQALGDELSAARVLNNLGMIQVDSGDWGAAEASFDRAFALADRLQHTATLGNIEINRGDLYLQQKQHVRAREHCDRAFEIYSRLESKAGLGETHKLYGILHRETLKPYLAEMHLLLALEMARGSQDRLLEAEVERERALVATVQGQDREALECLSRARRLFGELQARREVTDIDRRLSRLEADYLDVVTRWIASLEAADRHMAGHSRRVAELGCRLAEAVGMSPGEITTFRVGALLHDLGKLAIPADVLNKPGPLTPREWEMIREHPITGDRMIADKGLPWNVRPIVRSHHEHWDGSGYPDQLRGTKIPLGARILRIVDSYDALTSARSHRGPLDREEALRIMEREVDRVLDPEIFAVFRRILAGEGAASPS